MDKNCFQFRLEEGPAIGKPLSPFLANLFMGRFELEILNDFQYFPRIWTKYVDYIFGVFDTSKYEGICPVSQY